MLCSVRQLFASPAYIPTMVLPTEGRRIILASLSITSGKEISRKYGKAAGVFSTSILSTIGLSDTSNSSLCRGIHATASLSNVGGRMSPSEGGGNVTDSVICSYTHPCQSSNCCQFFRDTRSSDPKPDSRRCASRSTLLSAGNPMRLEVSGNSLKEK